MSAPWTEATYEGFTEESTSGEGYDPTSESEWDSPFAPAEAEQEIMTAEYGQEAGQQEYGQEAYSFSGYGSETEWESPFATAGLASDTEIELEPKEFPAQCGDKTAFGLPWNYGLKNKSDKNEGAEAGLVVVPRAEVLEVRLSQFDVDRYELKKKHKEAIAALTKRVKAGISEQRYSGETIKVYTYGEASSTATSIHNLELSGHRAFNVLHNIRCAFQAEGITVPVTYGFYATGEVHARVRGPDKTENPQFRGVIVRAFAPLKECKDCKPPGPKPPTGTTNICVSVPSIAPRVATKLPPDIIPLGSIVPGLKLPIAIVTKAQADVRVDDNRSRQSGLYKFQGWGLEVALPTGRTRIDLKADLHASLELLVRASASLSAKLRLGPLKLTLRVDASVFAQLVVKLCAQLRMRLEADLGRPGLPELRQCRIVEARGARGAFPFPALNGSAVLIVPGTGYGPAVVTFGGAGVPALGLSANPMPVPADKRTIKTLLALGGTLSLTQSGGARREAELEQLEQEWPEAFAELQPELAPFV
jgi:outer membrane protein OmpA-like peptidoglycan-associated protein